jgi:hypothetical protein
MRAVVLSLGLLVAPWGFVACSSASSNGANAAEGGEDAAASGTVGSPGDDGAAGTPEGSADGSSPAESIRDATASDAAGDGAARTTPDGGDAATGGLPYMIGIKTNSSADGPATVQGWLGRPLDVAGTTITTTSYIGSNQTYENAAGSPAPLLEVSFPLLSIFGENNALNDLAKAASGDYDATYEVMAMALAAWPNALLSARVGWEFNGNWYAWSKGVGTNATYANYVSAFQHAAKAIRKYNPKALIQWCVAWGQPDPTPYWPGAFDATTNPGGVDVISMDFYQANISQYNGGGHTSAWALAQSGVTIDLDWMVQYAHDKGVKIALSEYGAGSSSSKGEGSGAGLNDGTWTAASIAWMNAQPAGFFLWANWSDDAPADDIVTPNANPAEQAAWKTAWSGTHFAGSWWP